VSTTLAFLDSNERPFLEGSGLTIWARESAKLASLPPKAAPLPMLNAPVLETGWVAPKRPQSMWLLVGALHLVALWGFSQSFGPVAKLIQPDPVQVRLIAPPPPPPAPAPHTPVQIKLPVLASVPQIPPPAVMVASPVAAVVAVSDAAPTVTATHGHAQAPVAAAPATAATTAVVEIPPGSVRYLAEPRLHVPPMSRRLGESGTVLLRITVDTRGELKSVAIKKSSGFDRLDQQALRDILSARFAPYLDKGQPVEWQADAGLQYEVR